MFLSLLLHTDYSFQPSILNLFLNHIANLLLLWSHATLDMDYAVTLEAAVPVYNVETPNEVVRIAISKTGDMLNPDLKYVEITAVNRTCPNCGDSHEPAFVAANDGLAALELEMIVFNAEGEEHALRIARKEIGQKLRNIPLKILNVVAQDPPEERSSQK